MSVQKTARISKLGLRKGAKKNLDKMKRVMARNIKSLESRIHSLQQDLETRQEALKTLTVESYVPTRSNNEGIDLQDFTCGRKRNAKRNNSNAHGYNTLRRFFQGSGTRT